MRGGLVGVVLGILVGGVAAFSEEITLTTYYPSPRGVYDELRANRYASVQGPGPYVLDMKSGELRISQVVLYDRATAHPYGLRVEQGRLMLIDLNNNKGFVLLDLSED